MHEPYYNLFEDELRAERGPDGRHVALDVADLAQLDHLSRRQGGCAGVLEPGAVELGVAEAGDQRRHLRAGLAQEGERGDLVRIGVLLRLPRVALVEQVRPPGWHLHPVRKGFNAPGDVPVSPRDVERRSPPPAVPRLRRAFAAATARGWRAPAARSTRRSRPRTAPPGFLHASSRHIASQPSVLQPYRTLPRSRTLTSTTSLGLQTRGEGVRSRGHWATDYTGCWWRAKSVSLPTSGRWGSHGHRGGPAANGRRATEGPHVGLGLGRNLSVGRRHAGARSVRRRSDRTRSNSGRHRCVRHRRCRRHQHHRRRRAPARQLPGVFAPHPIGARRPDPRRGPGHGQFDIDSDQVRAFGAQDEALLEQLAAIVAPACRAARDRLALQAA